MSELYFKFEKPKSKFSSKRIKIPKENCKKYYEKSITKSRTPSNMQDNPFVILLFAYNPEYIGILRQDFKLFTKS